MKQWLTLLFLLTCGLVMMLLFLAKLEQLESRIDQLEARNASGGVEPNAKTDARVDDLEKEVSHNYPSVYEEAGLNLTIIGAFGTIAVTLAGVVYAFYTLDKTRKDFSNDARQQAIAVVNDTNSYLTGRFHNTIAFVLSEIAWDVDNGYAPRAPYLTGVAISNQKASYEAFRTSSNPLQTDMPEWTLRSLNNLIFMLSVQEIYSPQDNPESTQLAEYLAELRGRAEFSKNPVAINTYIFALLAFRKRLADERQTTVEEILREAFSLIEQQRNQDLKQSSVTELERLINLYNNSLLELHENTSPSEVPLPPEEGQLPEDPQAPPIIS